MDGGRRGSSSDDGHPGSRGRPHLDRHSGLGAAMASRTRSVATCRSNGCPFQAVWLSRRLTRCVACASGTGGSGGQIVGHLGSYGDAATRALSASLPDILERSPDSTLVLLGQHGDGFGRHLAGTHPRLAPRIHVTGQLSARALAEHVGACDLLVQPYPDGISSRRTSAMAGLALGVPVVTTRGRLTEPLWAETGCVALVSVDEPHALWLMKRFDCCRTIASGAILRRGAGTSTRASSICHTPSARSVAPRHKSRAHRHPELDESAGWWIRQLSPLRHPGARATRPRNRLLA